MASASSGTSAEISSIAKTLEDVFLEMQNARQAQTDAPPSYEASNVMAAIQGLYQQLGFIQTQALVSSHQANQYHNSQVSDSHRTAKM